MSISTHPGVKPPDLDEAGGARMGVLRSLVLAHQAGDVQAFALIAKDEYPVLYRHAVRRLTDARAAEDAVQETLLRAYRGLDGLGGDYHVSAWLHRILANVCADEGHRRQREGLVNARLSAERQPVQQPADISTEQREAARVIADAVVQLPAGYREALVMRDVLELDYADVASRAGITEQNARTRVHRARRALRRLVDVSSVLGVSIGGGFRRLARWPAEAAQHFGPQTTALAPDAAGLPLRAGVVASSLAAAVAVAASVPILVGGGSHQAPLPAPPQAAVGPGASGQVQTRLGAPVGTRMAPALTTPAAATPAAIVAVLPPRTTSTTVGAPKPKVVVTTPTPAPIVVARPFPETLLNARLNLDASSSGAMDGRGFILQTGSPQAASGRLSGNLAAAQPGVCSAVALKFAWTAAGHEYQMQLTGALAGAPLSNDQSGGWGQRRYVGLTTYQIAGTVLANGDPATGLTGPGRFRGLVVFGADGRPSSLQLTVDGASTPAPAVGLSCAAPAGPPTNSASPSGTPPASAPTATDSATGAATLETGAASATPPIG